MNLPPDSCPTREQKQRSATPYAQQKNGEPTLMITRRPWHYSSRKTGSGSSSLYLWDGSAHRKGLGHAIHHHGKWWLRRGSCHMRLQMFAHCDQKREWHQKLRRSQHPKPVSRACLVVAQDKGQQPNHQGKCCRLPKVIDQRSRPECRPMCGKDHHLSPFFAISCNIFSASFTSS